MTDGLSTLYQDLLNGSYDCVDRVVLNAYFRMGHDPGGFRVWWRALTGSDETLENAYLMRMAGRFSRRVRGYAKAHDIPGIDCSAGHRKHEVAGAYLPHCAGTVYRSKTPHRTQATDAVRQPLLVSHPRPGLGPSHDQDQRASPFPSPSDVEWARVRRLPSPQGGYRLHQGGKLFYCCLRRRGLGQDRRHLIRRTGDRAIEPSLRALDLHLLVLRARL